MKEKSYHYEVRLTRNGRGCGKSSIVDSLEEAKQKAVELCGRGEKASIYRCEVKDWEYYDGK